MLRGVCALLEPEEFDRPTAAIAAVRLHLRIALHEADSIRLIGRVGFLNPRRKHANVMVVMVSTCEVRYRRGVLGVNFAGHAVRRTCVCDAAPVRRGGIARRPHRVSCR